MILNICDRIPFAVGFYDMLLFRWFGSDFAWTQTSKFLTKPGFFSPAGSQQNDDRVPGVLVLFLESC
jgi:hypothetical protein